MSTDVIIVERQARQIERCRVLQMTSSPFEQVGDVVIFATRRSLQQRWRSAKRNSSTGARLFILFTEERGTLATSPTLHAACHILDVEALPTQSLYYHAAAFSKHVNMCLCHGMIMTWTRVLKIRVLNTSTNQASKTFTYRVTYVKTQMCTYMFYFLPLALYNIYTKVY